jgi:hypothetical protein
MAELPTSKVMRVTRSHIDVGLRIALHARRPNGFCACVVVTARNYNTWVRNCFIGLYLSTFIVVFS